MAPKAPPSAPPAPSTENDVLVPALVFLETKREQEAVVSEGVDCAVGGVLELIRNRQLDLISIDHTAEIVTADIAQIYAMVEVSYDPGGDDELETSSATGQSVTDSSDNKCGRTIRAELAGTLRPSPEPDPATIDRWARGWVVSRSTHSRDWSRLQPDRPQSSDDWGEDCRSLRSVRSIGTMNNSSRNSRTRRYKEATTAVPFPLEPDTRENQGLPPSMLTNKKKSGRGDGIGNGARNGSGNGRGVFGEGGDGQDMASRMKELGEQEWTIDNNGELLVVDRQRGDAMSKTVVTALYSVRDAVASRGDPTGGSGEARRKGGVGRGEEAPAWGRGNKTRRQSSSSSSLRRMSTSRSGSRRRSSRRQIGKGRGSEIFFEIESTLQPNLANSMERPGPGVSVCDGGSTKEGPLWPKDPSHMSRTEYEQRQRNDCGAAHNLGADTCDDEDMSTLGFSLGSVQSAPALGGLGLGLHGGSNDGGGRGRGGGRGGRRRGHNKRSPRAGTAGPAVPDHRGHSFTAFDSVNPLEGGVRVATSCGAGFDSNRLEGGSRGARGGGGRARGGGGGGGGGALSPLSTSVTGASSVGPESVGGQGENDDEDGTDPHLSLLEDPDWGSNTRGSPKQAGLLPKVKHTSRERPLTHERPHTRNPRDPRKVPARQHIHASPISNSSTNTIKHTVAREEGGAGEDNKSDAGSSASSAFPSLPMALAGWGLPLSSRGGRVVVGGSSGGNAKGGRNNGVITMAKPMEIVVEGLLR